MACAAVVLKQKYDVGARLCSEHVWDTPLRVVAKIYGLFSPYRMFTCIYITFVAILLAIILLRAVYYLVADFLHGAFPVYAHAHRTPCRTTIT